MEKTLSKKKGTLMKNRSFFKRPLCLLLLGCLALSLCACPGATDDPPAGGCAHTYENGYCTLCGAKDPTYTPPVNPNVTYGDGEVIDGAGDSLAADATVLLPITYDATAAEELQAPTLFRSWASKMAEGKTFMCQGTATLAESNGKDKVYDGKGATLILESALTIKGVENVTIKNITIVGDVKIASGTGVIFENAKILGGITAEKAASSIVLNGCRVEAATAITTAATDLSVINSALAFTACGVLDTGKGTFVENCRIVGTGVAISSSATVDASFRYNTVTVGEKDKAITIDTGAQNALVAMNIIRGPQVSVQVTGARNAVVVSNTLISVEASENRNLYICDNAMGGRVIAKNNNYFLADGNRYKNDGQTHDAVLENNQNVNGNTLTDVDARLEVGADETLLPHVDKTLFVHMERKATVKDPASSVKQSVSEYVAAQSAEKGIVILSPGVYKTYGPITFTAEQSNTVLYAYGVYVERVEEKGKNSIGSLLTCESTDNVTVKGLTVGYEQPSAMQVYVIDKQKSGGTCTLTVLPGAGMINEFGDTNATYYLNMTAYLHKADQDYIPIGDIELGAVSKRSDGTIRITLENPEDYEVIEIGDALTNRYQSYSRTVYTEKSANVTYLDVTAYGIAGAFCCFEKENRSAVTYYRFADTTRLGELIDKATYEKYEAYEAEYGINFEIRSEDGYYYGSVPHVSSIDGIQALSCEQGSQVISCLFENMCDDGSLQKGQHARLAKIIDNGDGTATIIFKGNLSLQRGQTSTPDAFCATIRKGDRVAIYTAFGQLICDSIAQSDEKGYDTVISDYNGKKVVRKQVTVLTKDLHPDYQTILAGYQRDANGFLSDDGQATKEKILVDNFSRGCNGFLFDNVLVQNNRSRGFLIKASDGAIKNCTIRNNAKLAVAVIYEIYWGESSFSENVRIENNLIDHVGYALYNNGQYLHYPINISGLGGGTTDEDYLLYKNIRIVGNKFINRVNEYAVYIQAAKNVLLENNDFGCFDEENEDYYAKSVLLNGASGITLNNNTYSPFIPFEELIDGSYYKNVTGTDVMLDGVSIIPDKEEE